MSAHLPTAVLWDMDGTIVDTEPLWVDAQRALLAEFGLPQFDEISEEALVGAGMHETAMLFQRAGVPLSATEIVEFVVEGVASRLPNELDWRPGAVELLAELHEVGVPLALVTNSPRDMALLVVEGLPAGTFATIVGADDVTRGKPHPQPYLLGAERLGVAPTSACVVIEDSSHGLRSGAAAGMTTVGIPHGARLTSADADVLLPTLAGVRANDLFDHVMAVSA
ncbi:phosphoglycolate phosphatase [Pseudoclavibacter endophyticus]|uniref:HAD family phosphatase n=1 Tax=Pseudoclavibacter endophyticus TaxID=1778590 RepID=A0A6H9WMT8_9MICO|nr:HAD family phosphatase [Pseudoclavibacter endophyticus]KAB1650186.1 HAD family phosphatase [Pseudoclavibacter endophyticus]GGA56388.1 phosphoglycolate phosphatase [Pseudoclavibacter endophyticus]